MVEIGRKIRQYRLQLDLTQEELAQRTELTKGYISQLENDLCSPSIATLEDILNVLGVTLAQFFAEPKEERIVYTQGDFFVSQNGTAVSTWLIPDSQVKQMEPIILTMQAGEQSQERFPFEGEEFGYVLEGELEICFEADSRVVKVGQAFSVNGMKQHILKNTSQAQCRVLWITTPSNF